MSSAVETIRNAPSALVTSAARALVEQHGIAENVAKQVSYDFGSTHDNEVRTRDFFVSTTSDAAHVSFEAYQDKGPHWSHGWRGTRVTVALTGSALEALAAGVSTALEKAKTPDAAYETLPAPLQFR
jgi:hypothetical protein